MAFGGLLALGGVDIDVAQGERLAVLGPNGAGKTTLFNAIAGDITPTSGTVTIKGVDCTPLPSRLRPQLGVARTYQKTRLFGGLTRRGQPVPRTGGQAWTPPLACGATHGTPRCASGTRRGRTCLARPSSSTTKVRDLSHGQQRQLEIGIALVTEPDLIMLDEPASGLSRGERERLIELLEGLPARLDAAADRTRHGRRTEGRRPGRRDGRRQDRRRRDTRRDPQRSRWCTRSISEKQADARRAAAGRRACAPATAPRGCSTSSRSRWRTRR